MITFGFILHICFLDRQNNIPLSSSINKRTQCLHSKNNIISYYVGIMQPHVRGFYTGSQGKGQNIRQNERILKF